MSSGFEVKVYSLLTNGLKPLEDTILPIGQIVWLNGYGQNEHYHDRQVIYSSYKRFDGRIMYECVNVDNMTTATHEAYNIRHEKDIFGIGTYYKTGDIFEDIASLPELVKQAKANEIKIREQEKQQAKSKAEAEAKEKQELPKKYPYLKQAKDFEKISRHALGAKNIKIELEREFPSIKFTVKSESYSGGNSIDVSWTDGVTTDQVDKIIDKYQECHFNGMEDLEEYVDQVFTDVFGGAKYVHSNRHITNERYIETAKEFGYDVHYEKYDMIGVDYETRRMIERETYQKSFYTKPEPIKPEPKKRETMQKATFSNNKPVARWNGTEFVTI